MEDDKIYHMAEKIITKTMNKVMSERINLKDKDDIKLDTETEILMLLTEANISDELEKQILSVMKIFDKVFERVYKKSIMERETKDRNSEELGER